jgi:hypothetical protein
VPEANPSASVTRCSVSYHGGSSAPNEHLMDDVWSPTANLAEVDRMQALIQPGTGDLTGAIAPIRTFISTHRDRVHYELAAPPAGFAAQPDHFCFFD